MPRLHFRSLTRLLLLLALALPPLACVPNDSTDAVPPPAPAAPASTSTAPAPASAASPAQAYCQAALAACDAVEARIPEFSAVAEVLAQRYQDGGVIGYVMNGQSLGSELLGRAGGLMASGFNWRGARRRPEAQRAHDVAIIGWDAAPVQDDLAELRSLKERGVYIVGFGPRALPELAEEVALCDAFFDTGYAADDHVVTLADGSAAGKMNHLVNALGGWALIGETVAALTRDGQMPVIWKSFMVPDGQEWAKRYEGRRFHDPAEFTVAPVPAGEISRQYLEAIRGLIRRFADSQLDEVAQAADLIAQAHRAGRGIFAIGAGHMPGYYLGRYRDAAWTRGMELHDFIDTQVARFRSEAPQGGLAVYLGYYGQPKGITDLLGEKEMDEILLTAFHPNRAAQAPADVLVTIDTGYPFGDALVPIEGYPLRLLPPSGVIQVVAWEALNAEVLERLGEEQ